MNRLCLAAVFLGSCNSTALAQWQRQTIHCDADFRGLAVVSAEVAWVSGTKGTYGRTTDAGKTWSAGRVSGAEKLDFRDVEAFGEVTAYLMSAGPGRASRIYRTDDAGKNWVLQFENPEPEGFLDAIAFWDDRNGVALGDPVNGQFQLLLTKDGGTSWKRTPGTRLPPALPHEGVFAASGTCLVTQGKNDVWFCTGGAKTGRVFHSADRGRNWTVSETPILAGADSAGAFSIAFRDRDHGMIVGGDYRRPNDPGPTAAATSDGGKTWTPTRSPLAYRSCVAWSKDRWVAVGTSGSDVSPDDGANWKPLDHERYNTVGFTAAGQGWAVGPGARIARFVTESGTLPGDPVRPGGSRR